MKGFANAKEAQTTVHPKKPSQLKEMTQSVSEPWRSARWEGHTVERARVAKEDGVAEDKGSKHRLDEVLEQGVRANQLSVAPILNNEVSCGKGGRRQRGRQLRQRANAVRWRRACWGPWGAWAETAPPGEGRTRAASRKACV